MGSWVLITAVWYKRASLSENSCRPWVWIVPSLNAVTNALLISSVVPSNFEHARSNAALIGIHVVSGGFIKERTSAVVPAK